MRPLSCFLQSRYLTFSPRGPKNDYCPKSLPKKSFSSKFNPKHVADIGFDLRNEFHANRMKFGILETKGFFRVNFDLF
jgi:hypothetical protein